MSSSRRLSSLGGGSGKALGKSSFVNTCNLLSRYVKEKGSLRDFNLEIDGKIECLESIMKSGSIQTSSNPAPASKNLLTHIEKSAQLSTDFSPPVIQVEDTTPNDIKVSSSKEAAAIDPKSAQLTIFYAGRVMVFDDCPAAKAQELVAFARKWSPQITGGIAATISTEEANPVVATAATSISLDEVHPKPRNGKEKPRSEAIDLEKAVGISSNTCKEIRIHESGGVGSNSKTEANNTLDLPIARRASVHRFLEKRKERATARGPYQIQEAGPQAASSSSSRGDGHLDLKL